MAKAATWTGTDAEARKLGEQTGLDTLVVLAVNDEHLVLRVSTPAVPKLTHKVLRLGSTVARLKLKGIDGGPHKRWSMWFNSTTTRRTLPGFELRWIAPEMEFPFGAVVEVLHGCRQLVS